LSPNTHRQLNLSIIVRSSYSGLSKTSERPRSLAQFQIAAGQTLQAVTVKGPLDHAQDKNAPQVHARTTPVVIHLRAHAPFEDLKYLLANFFVRVQGLQPRRNVIALLETYQNPDGTVRIPAVLQPYMGGLTQIG